MPKDINIHLKTTGAPLTQKEIGDVAREIGSLSDVAKRTSEELKKPGENLKGIKSLSDIAKESQRELGGMADGVKQVGDKTTEAGSKAEKASGIFSTFFGRFTGPLGIVAAIAAVAKLGSTVSTFFDTIKQRSDEAVRQLDQVRGGFTDIFEALNAFDEKSRQAATKETYELLKKTATPEAIGLPIVNAYIRQFKGLVDAGQLTAEQYQQGMETMLSYGARHGGAATPDLIELMGGWGMNQPDQQAAFTRQIAAASQAVNLRDEDIIAALSKGVSTIKAMAWSPEQALEAVGTMAAGEPAPRMRVGMPTAGLQAIMVPPQPEKLAYAEVEVAQRAKSAADKAKAEAARTKTYALKRAADQAEADADAKQLLADQAIAAAEKLAEDPLAFLRAVEEKRSAMTRERFNRLLRDIYGAEGGLAVGKLIMERRKDLPATIERAASAEGAAADRGEEERAKTTLEGRDATTKAETKLIQSDVTEEEKRKEDIREIGREKYKLLRRRKPILMRFREIFTSTLRAAQEEYGARQQWEDTLTPEEKETFTKEFPLKPVGFGGGPLPLSPLDQKWQSMTTLEKWEALTRPSPVVAPIPGVQPPATEIPPIPNVPPSATESPPIPGAPLPATEGPPQAMHFDNRIINYQIFNPVSGMNKQDLGIEPPNLYV